MKNIQCMYFFVAAVMLITAGCRTTPQPVLGVSPPSLSFEATGDEIKTIEITSNVYWTISKLPAWIEVTSSTGNGTATVDVKAKANTTNADREGFFIITATGVPELTMTVNQDAPKTATSKAIGVTAPVAGATPATVINETAQFTGTVTWSPADATFRNGVVYTATITLTPKPGFTLAGVTENSFTIAGASSVSNMANNGVITAIFPTTGSATVNMAAIDGVTAPVAGATPATIVAETAQYTGTVAWSPANVPFGSGAVYTATITLTPKTGYTLEGVTANFFTVAGVTSVSNAANSGVITAVFPATEASKISLAEIGGVTAPVAGATPKTTVTETAQYTGVVVWSPAVASTFDYAQTYTATITLTPKTGYTFTGVTANSFTVAGATATNAANSGVITAVFPATVSKISLAEIGGLTAPAAGATPVTAVTATDQYTGATWSPAVSGTFTGATAYTATITLTPKTGYTLAGITANFFTVAGATTTNAANSGVITAVFPATAAVKISLAAIGGVTAPARGATPVTAITATDQYTGAVTWSPTVSGAFAAVTTYTATITLTPKTGYTLTGVTANFFTVAGATTVSNAANSGVITAVFPATAAAPVSIAAIAGVTAPVAGATPVTSITATAQYAGAVAWSPAVSGAFAYATTYSAVITLTPATGYTMTGVAANFFTVAGAQTITYAAGSNMITAVFPVTAPAPDGSEGNPFIVNSEATLRQVGFGTNGWTLDKCYKQTANITLNGNWTPIGNNTTSFTGTYDGGGYSIDNVTISTTASYQGLFGYIGQKGVVRNVALRSVNITSTNDSGNIGGIAGYNSGTIENCYVTGKLSGKSIVGGVAGQSIGGYSMIKNCYSTCDVTGSSSYIGGIAGGISTSPITNCYATGKITGYDYVGGIVGQNQYSTVERCVALNAQITATSSVAAYNVNIGRIIGNVTSGSVSYVYARYGMIFIINGTTYTNNMGAGYNGTDVDAVYYTGSGSGTWWSGTLGYSTTYWSLANSRLPHLKTSAGGTFNQTQTPAL